jgi:YjbR
MTADQFRKLVLRFDSAEEHAHHGHPDFRANGRIFATLGYPNDTRAMVKLTPEQQAEFVHDYPEVFTPASGKWGLQGATSIHLPKGHKTELSRAVEGAWRNAMAAPPSRTKRKSATR